MDNTGKEIRIHRGPKELLRMGHGFPLANAYIDPLLAQPGKLRWRAPRLQLPRLPFS